MRKNVFGRQFKRDTNERKALFKGLMSSLVLEGRIQTTEEKAKAIRGKIEKLVTRTRKTQTSNYNFLQEYLSPDALKAMVSEIAPRFKQRQGGYTRIIKLGNRVSDNAGMAFIEWVDHQEVLDKKILENKERAEKKTLRQAQGKAKKLKKENKKPVKAGKKSSSKESKKKK
ncbi:MAG: 50S ribosomal protein L17 [Patescibacteria group bacterium]|nr:50S ribosomal protein L17 [Patescibacteria group bacterium]